MASDSPPLFATKLPNLNPNPNLMINLDFNHPQNAAVFNEDDEIDVDDDDVDDYDADDYDRKPPSSAANHQVTIAAVSTLNPAHQKPTGPTIGPPYPIDESRKLFQRLWTDEDEIELLQGFLDYNNQRGTSNNHHYETSVFYDQIKSRLQLDFNKNQLVEKLRRLKKKYRNVVQKIGAGKEYVLKSPHDQATFEISKKIWGAGIGATNVNYNVNTNTATTTPTHVKVNDEGDEDDDRSPNVGFGSGLIAFSPNASGVDEKVPIRARKRARVSVGGGGVVNVVTTPVSDQTAGGVGGANVIEETIRSCLSPVFKELLNGVVNLRNGARGVGGLGELATMPFGLGFGGFGSGGGVDLGAGGDEKWRNQQILELEVFSKRLELVQDRIKVQLEELRGKGS